MPLACSGQASSGRLAGVKRVRLGFASPTLRNPLPLRGKGQGEGALPSQRDMLLRRASRLLAHEAGGCGAHDLGRVALHLEDGQAALVQAVRAEAEDAVEPAEAV